MKPSIPLIVGALLLTGCQNTNPPCAPCGANCTDAEARATLARLAPPASAPSESHVPDPREFDERLSTFAYPYQEKVFPVSYKGRKLDMVYMHVVPKGVTLGTVLLLHGKNFSGAYWKPVADDLVAKGYAVVIPDQIGFGKSSKPTDYAYSFHAFSKNTKSLLDALNVVTPVTVVGHSMGGMVATRFALMYPDATARLVLANPIGLEDWKTLVPYQSVDDWYASELTKTPEKVKAYMTASYFDGVWKDDYAPLLALQAGWTKDPDYPTIARTSALTYEMIFTEPVVYEFPNLTAPTLLIIGDRDRTALGKNLVKPEIAKTMGRYNELGPKTAKAIPGAKLVVLKGIGHIPQYESFDAFQAALLKFLKD